MARLCRWLTGETSQQQQSEEPTQHEDDDRCERAELARRIHEAKQRLRMLGWQADVEGRWQSPDDPRED